MIRMRGLVRRPTPVVRDERLATSRAFAQWLAFGFVFAEDVALAELERLDAAMAQWQSADAGSWATASTVDQDDYLSDLLVEVVRDALACVPTDRPIVLSLSGGHDSRAIAAAWPGRSLRAATYGRPGSVDFDTVSMVGPAQGADVRWYDARGLEWQRESLVAELAGQSDRLLSPRSVVQPLLDSEFGPHTLVHGYANGPLTGSRARPQGSWSEELRAFAMLQDVFGFQAALGDRSVVGLLPERPWPGRVPWAAQLTSLRQRQRIRPSSTKTRHVVLPFDDERWRGFWLSRSLPELVGRRRWLDLLARKYSPWFPELASWDGLEPARQVQRRWLSENAPPREESDLGPVRPAADHCWCSDYRDNASFRSLVDDSVDRLRARRVFHDRFLDSALRVWHRTPGTGWRALRGLVATELSLAAGFFD